MGRCRVVVSQGITVRSTVVPNAIPAEMIRFDIDAGNIISKEKIEVSLYEQWDLCLYRLPKRCKRLSMKMIR